MSEKVMVQNDAATLWFDEEHGIVHHAFHRFTHGRAFREILNAGCDLMKEHKARKWLSDDRGNTALPKEDTLWAQTDWFPRVVAAGWKYWALVQPTAVVGQLNMRRFTEQYAEQGLTVRVFSELEPAQEWLRQQP